MEFPKCYWIWNYRLWVLEQAIERLAVATARRIWEEELGLVSKMLTKDRRNFHAWGYRRHVVARLESPVLQGKSMVEDEFAYTTRMVNVDLSNFSAWHNRAKLIPRLLEERGADAVARKALFDSGKTANLRCFPMKRMLTNLSRDRPHTRCTRCGPRGPVSVVLPPVSPP